MRVIDPGNWHELDTLDRVSGWADEFKQLRFVKRIGAKYPGNEPPGYGGTTSQEVIRALIDRTKYVDAQIDRTTEVSQLGHVANAKVIGHLRQALIWLEMRAALERGDNMASHLIDGLQEPELAETCDHCGHVLCRRAHEERAR